jgi:hypothetical protein
VQLTFLEEKISQVKGFLASQTIPGVESASRALQEVLVSRKKIAQKQGRLDRF